MHKHWKECIRMQLKKMNTVKLSIIILNYNAKDFVIKALQSIEKAYPKEMTTGSFEIIVVDNASTDGSLVALKEYKKQKHKEALHIVDAKENGGFAKGNNTGVALAKGTYVLFLNPDTIVYPHTLTRMIDFMNSHPDAGAATCRVEIPSGDIDEASHRGFPTPWNAFTHFSGLEKLFPHSRLFAGYTRGWENLQSVHTVPAVVGAFLFVRREVGEKVGWWDEDYFFYGEDLQFCYDIWKVGYKIYYVPDVKILHYGGVSSGIKKHSQAITTANRKTKQKVQQWRFDAMRIFYKKNYQHHHPVLSWLVLLGINMLHKKNA